MNKIQSRLRLLTAVFAGAAMLLLSGASMADPPARVARLSFFSGPVSFSPAGEDEWALATPNRPLITGDRLWADAGGRAELQAGSIALRLGASTNVNVLNLDDRATQLELTQGSLYVRVWRIDRGDTVEIDTPNLAFTVNSVGRYRIDVDAEGNVTTLAVLAGQGEAYGEGAAYRIGAGDRYSFSGTGLRDYEYSDIGAPDEFDRWAADRDRSYDTSVSARYVSRDVIGYQDLDQYGSWSAVADYGNVWYPRSMPSGWAPYRTGHWAWIDPWGWTWIDEAPWGFAPYHYGRWAFVTGRWGWIPGPVNVRPIYAPALVAFIGSGDLRLSLSVGGVASGVAWFPLGPGEVYQPAYRVSRDYFTNVNVSNTRVTNVNITNVYNNYTTNTTVTNVTYRNREAPGAVTAVPTTAFVQSQPVARSAVQVSREVITQQPVSAVARVAPTRASVVAAAGVAAAGAAAAVAAAPGRPPARAMQREVVARTKPPAPPPAFATRQAALAANPGRPAEPAATAQQQPAAAGAAPARNVKVVPPTQAAAPAPKDENRRGRGQLERRAGASGAPQGAPAAAPGTPAGPQAAPAGQPTVPATGQAPKGTAAAPPTAAGQTAPVPRPPDAEQRRQQQEQQKAQQAEQQRQQQQSQQADQRRQQQEQQQGQQQRQQAEQQRQQQLSQQAEQRRQQQEQQQGQQQRQQAEQQRQQQQSQQAEQRRQQQEQQKAQQAEQQRQQQQSQQAD
ncbi:MAG TPA: P83/100 family protein, partial [Casimicrobiaceae bacterium]|nr:P83/100 family protein [Casimicrobiaceae bacterium]